MKRVALVVVSLTLAACPALTPASIPCRTNSNCPTGSGCNAAGVCEAGIPGTSGEVLIVGPATANVSVGGTQTFTATVDGVAVTATWTVEGEGTITAEGVYTAPVKLPAPAQATIHAARVDAAQVSATAVVFLVERNPEPALSTIAPATLSAGAAATELTLTGTGFVAGSTVTVDTQTLTPSAVTSTSLTVTAPPEVFATAGSKPVKVTNPAPGGGTSRVVSLSVTSPAPTVSAATPSSGVTGAADTVVELAGTGFTGETTASFDGADVTITARSPASLSITVPASALTTARTVTITVTNPAPGGGMASTTFDVQNPVPALTSVTPSSVSAGSSGLTVIVKGTGFTPSTTLKSGATGLTATFVSATELSVAMPASLLATAGVVPVVATNAAPGGGTSTALNFTVTNPAPVLLSLSSSGVQVGSPMLTLTLNGGGFLGGSTVFWASSSLTTTFVSATQLTARVPASFLATAGNYAVTVVNPMPGGGTSAAQTFRVDNPAPTLSTLSATSLSAGSAQFTLTLTGTNFVNTTTASFGGVSLTTTYVSATSLTAVVPAPQLATGKQVQVTVQTPAPGGGPSNGLTFTINNPTASLGSLVPSSALSGSVDLPLTINGTGFVSGATVTFDGMAVSSTFVSATQLNCTVPASMLTRAHTVTVTATNPAPAGGALNTLTFRIDAVIRTVTGGTGEGGPAIKAMLNRPIFMARHPITGEIYLPQIDRALIWRIDATGNLQRVAGTGVAGYSGDNVPATSASISVPRGLVFDPAGNLYFSDSGNSRIRKIDTAGIITTVGGTGACDSTGDNGLATSAAIGDVYGMRLNGNDLYVAQCGCNGHRVRKITLGGNVTPVAGTGIGSSTGDNGPATSATLNCPISVAFDSANQVYIAEWSGARVRKVASNGTITTYAGSSSTVQSGDGAAATLAGLPNPRDLLFDSNDNLYISSFWGYRIRKVDFATNVISTVVGTTQGKVSADGTAATAALIGHPAAMFFDGSGALNFSTVQDQNSDLNLVMKVSGGNIVTVAGRAQQTTAANSLFYRPYGIAIDPVGNRYLSDKENDRILKLDVAGNVSVVAGNGTRGVAGDGNPATLAQLAQPEGLWLDSSGNLYFAEVANGRVRKVDAAGIITTVAGGGSYVAGCPGGAPTAIPSGAGSNYNCIGDDYLAAAATLVNPRFVVGDNAGTLYISEYDVQTTPAAVNRGNRVRKVSLSTGRITTIAGSTALNTTTCGFSGDGAAASSALLCAPVGLALTPAGDLLVADSSNRRIRRINLVTSPVGNIVTVAGTGALGSGGNGGPALVATFRRPFGLVFDGQGNLIVTDYDSGTVRLIDSSQNMQLVAGIGQSGFGGDTGAARDALLYGPAQVAVSPSSSLIYIVDQLNDRLRVVGP